MYKLFVFVFCLALFACSSGSEETPSEPVEEVEKPVTIFAVAGHVYGDATQFTGSVHPPFMKKFREVKANLAADGMEINSLFLTGDVIARPTPARWDSTVQQLDSLIDDWYIAPGNHDFGGGFNQIAQEANYFSVKPEEDLFLVLNTSQRGWNVDPGQKHFIEARLKNLKEGANLFVFTHQLWWQKDPPPEYEIDSIRTNSYALFDGDSSFWQTVFPMLKDLPNECYYFAGDLGADAVLESYYEDHWENHHFYGSGMGSKKADNFLLGKVYEDGTVEIQRIDF